MSQIAQLKEAERKASQLVQDARKARVDRMKEAKSESEEKILEYKRELEANYQKAVANNSGSTGVADSALDKETSAGIAQMQKEFDSNKKKVEQMLIDLVCAVNIEAPKDNLSLLSESSQF